MGRFVGVQPLPDGPARVDGCELLVLEAGEHTITVGDMSETIVVE